MMNLKRTFRIWKHRRSLRRDAERALSCASETYWNELSKSEELRDNALIDESLSTIQCASSILAEGARTARTRLFSSCGPMRRVMTAALVCILVIALSAGAAYAMGVDVWGMFFSTGNGHSALYTDPLSKSNQDDYEPFPSVIPMDDFKNYSDVHSACTDLHLSPMLIDSNLITEMSIDEIYGMTSESSITLFIDYSVKDRALHYMTVRYPDNDTAVLLTAEGFDAAAETMESEGITYYIVDGEYETLVMWSHDCYAYQITSDFEKTELMTVLKTLKPN